MDAPYFYLVKFWVHPESRKAVLEWLDSGHMADMVALPGFLFVRRVKLEQDSADGWSGFMMIYGVESKTALQHYFDGPAPAKFAQQRKQSRIARFTGWTTACCIQPRPWPQ